MVGVVQLARAPDCGSGGRGFEPHHSPHFHQEPRGFSLGCRQEVKARDFDSRTVGSNPATPARFDPLAQSVEHLTFNQGVRSSNLRRVTNFAFGIQCICEGISGRGGIGRRAGFRFRCRRVYEFESLRPHHFRLRIICGNSSFGRAPPCQGGGGGFEPRFPLQALGQIREHFFNRKEAQ